MKSFIKLFFEKLRLFLVRPKLLQKFPPKNLMSLSNSIKFKRFNLNSSNYNLLVLKIENHGYCSNESYGLILGMNNRCEKCR
jgi:hypothetical protein